MDINPTEENLEVTSEEAGHGVYRIRVRGNLELATSEVLRNHLAEVLRAGHKHLMMDLNEVGYLDSSGLAVLLGTLRRVRENQGSLRLVCNVRPVLRVLGLTGLDRLLAIHPNEESALRDLPRND
jgi:anti-sigma B factor antagonist